MKDTLRKTSASGRPRRRDCSTSATQNHGDLAAAAVAAVSAINASNLYISPPRHLTQKSSFTRRSSSATRENNNLGFKTGSMRQQRQPEQSPERDGLKPAGSQPDPIEEAMARAIFQKLEAGEYGRQRHRDPKYREWIVDPEDIHDHPDAQRSANGAESAYANSDITGHLRSVSYSVEPQVKTEEPQRSHSFGGVQAFNQVQIAEERAEIAPRPSGPSVSDGLGLTNKLRHFRLERKESKQEKRHQRLKDSISKPEVLLLSNRAVGMLDEGEQHAYFENPRKAENPFLSEAERLNMKAHQVEEERMAVLFKAEKIRGAPMPPRPAPTTQRSGYGPASEVPAHQQRQVPATQRSFHREQLYNFPPKQTKQVNTPPRQQRPVPTAQNPAPAYVPQAPKPDPKERNASRETVWGDFIRPELLQEPLLAARPVPQPVQRPAAKPEVRPEPQPAVAMTHRYAVPKRQSSLLKKAGRLFHRPGHGELEIERVTNPFLDSRKAKPPPLDLRKLPNANDRLRIVLDTTKVAPKWKGKEHAYEPEAPLTHPETGPSEYSHIPVPPIPESNNHRNNAQRAYTPTDNPFKTPIAMIDNLRVRNNDANGDASSLQTSKSFVWNGEWDSDSEGSKAPLEEYEEEQRRSKEAQGFEEYVPPRSLWKNGKTSDETHEIRDTRFYDFWDEVLKRTDSDSQTRK